MIAQRLHYESGDQIEDLVQEVLVKLLRQVREVEVREPEGLLSKIVHCTVVDHVRRRARWSLVVTWEPQEAWEPPDRTASAPDSFEDPVDRVVDVALGFFRESDTRCFELAGHFFAERDWSEVAGREGRSSSAVRKQWSRCLGKLRTAARTLPEFVPLRELFEAS